jgi:glycine dehydrogenase subunit 2
MNKTVKTLFDGGKTGRVAQAQIPKVTGSVSIPQNFRREKLNWPEWSELDVVRHYTRLSTKNFGIDLNFYPLGSCTMKYNPRGAHRAAFMQGFVDRHPLATVCVQQGFLEVLYGLQDSILSITGMTGVSLAPMAGAQGELAGIAMIKAYHESRQDFARQEIIVPQAAHGTNPATAVMCGYTVREIPVLANGDVDLEALKQVVGPQTAGLMMTNPSTCGVFEQQVLDVQKTVHDVGGLLYYDGANLNAIMGRAKPGFMGFDVMHLNLHKTFATPHGGGGPGAGPVACNDKLKPFLPSPVVVKDASGYRFSTAADYPQSIGPMSAFMGNAGVLIRAAYYAYVLGDVGLAQVSDMATLNANYLMARLEQAGFELAYPKRRASHEFIITFAKLTEKTGVTAMDLAKRLLDYGFHAPTTYFPLIVPECWLIEPTETESKETLDAFVDAMILILEEANTQPDFVKAAPHKMSVKRLDDVRAAKQLDLAATIG